MNTNHFKGGYCVKQKDAFKSAGGNVLSWFFHFSTYALNVAQAELKGTSNSRQKFKMFIDLYYVISGKGMSKYKQMLEVIKYPHFHCKNVTEKKSEKITLPVKK